MTRTDETNEAQIEHKLKKEILNAHKVYKPHEHKSKRSSVHIYFLISKSSTHTLNKLFK